MAYICSFTVNPFTANVFVESFLKLWVDNECVGNEQAFVSLGFSLDFHYALGLPKLSLFQLPIVFFLLKKM